jgi:predicted carbohydrate-binding protein with CBM5 and CBM33 domain
MGKRGRPAKTDKFEDLDNEFKDAVAGMDVVALNNKIAEVAKNEENNQNLKKDDQQLAEAKEAAKMANEPYKDASKANKLRIQFCMRVLGDRGQA